MKRNFKLHIVLMLTVMFGMFSMVQRSVPIPMARPILTNGRIVFVSDSDGDREIYSINPDGTDLQQLTFNTQYDDFPKWSPDGNRIAFVRDFDLYLMDADGSNQTLLLDGDDIGSLEWSPDGNRIAFSERVGANTDIFLLDLGIMTISNLTNTPDDLDFSPAWSPDGNRIAFASTGDNPIPRPVDGNPRWDLYTVNLDGTNRAKILEGSSYIGGLDWTIPGQIFFDDVGSLPLALNIFSVNVTTGERTALTSGQLDFASPTLSPDGKQIAFFHGDQLAIMDIDGDNVTVITNSPDRKVHTDWQPLMRASSATLPFRAWS